MNAARRKQKRMHMVLWAMLTQHVGPVLSWCYLLEWARLGGTADEVPQC